MLTRLAAALLLISSFAAAAGGTRIGHTQANQTTVRIPNECAGLNGHKLNLCIHTTAHRRLQDGEATTITTTTDVPAACVGWKENKIQQCIEEQALITSILNQNNLDSIPSECAGLNTNNLGECLSERQTILDQNGVTSVPSMCQGMGIDKLENCLVDHNLVQTILTANKLQDVPDACAEKDADKLTECLQQWRLTQIILGLSNERIPPECVGMEKEKDLETCLEEFTLAPTNYPTYNPTSSPVTYPPTVYSSYMPTGSPVAWNQFAAEIEFQSASEEEKDALFNVLDGQVALPIGKYSMSLTRYVNKKQNRNYNRLRRTLQRQDENHPRQYELDATRQHLRDVYEAEFHMPVARVDLHFLDGGETEIGLNADGTTGDGLVRHSTFFGNVLFVQDDRQANNAEHTLPTEEQLEQATLNAFTGEQKQSFIEKYHYEVTGRKYFGLKYTYDVNVRKNLQPDVVVPSTAILPEGFEEGGGTGSSSTADQEGGMSWGARIQQWSSSVESLGTSTVFIVVIVLAGVLLGTLIGLTAVVVRRKRDNISKEPQFRVVLGDCIDDEPDALGSVIGSEIIESGSDMLFARVQTLSKVQSSNKVQSSLPKIMSDDYEDCVSHLAASDEDSVDKAMEKETKEMDSRGSTKEIDSGDSDSTWSYSLKSAGSGSVSEKEASSRDEVDIEQQLT